MEAATFSMYKSKEEEAQNQSVGRRMRRKESLATLKKNLFFSIFFTMGMAFPVMCVSANAFKSTV
jgi:hypothetical protein